MCVSFQRSGAVPGAVSAPRLVAVLVVSLLVGVGVAVLASVIAAPAAVAQDAPETEFVIDGSQAVVTVVASDEVRPGPSPAGSPSNWPYICHWDEVFNNTDVVLGPTTNLERGHRYWLRCDPQPDSGRDPIGQFVVYDPADPVPGEAAITSLVIRDFVRDQGLVQPLPLAVGISPGGIQITGVETWLWPDGSIERIQASAHAGGLTVTVQARFDHTAFDVDEPGVQPIVCTEQQPWQPGSDEATCSHTYLTEALGRTITGSSEWDFVWWDDAAQPTPVYWETVVLDEQYDVDVIDLEAVITARR